VMRTTTFGSGQETSSVRSRRSLVVRFETARIEGSVLPVVFLRKDELSDPRIRLNRSDS